MSTPTTTAFGLDAYEDIEALPLSELAPRIVRVRVDITDEPTPTQRLHEALTKELILMQKRFNGARKTIIAFKLGEFAMVLQLLTSDSKVDVALKVKKQIGTPAVGPGETMEVVGKMYAIVHNALNLPTLSCVVGERYCDNKVLVLESVLDKAKQTGDAGRIHLVRDFIGPDMSHEWIWPHNTNRSTHMNFTVRLEYIPANPLPHHVPLRFAI